MRFPSSRMRPACACWESDMTCEQAVQWHEAGGDGWAQRRGAESRVEEARGGAGGGWVRWVGISGGGGQAWAGRVLHR
eukprot:scaffold5157_cov22-Tisochrysis_lutea.AAC.1